MTLLSFSLFIYALCYGINLSLINVTKISVHAWSLKNVVKEAFIIINRFSEHQRLLARIALSLIESTNLKVFFANYGQ